MCKRKFVRFFVKILKINLYIFPKLCFVTCVIIVSLIYLLKQLEVTLIQQPEYPKILWWTNNFPGTSGIKHCSENVHCHIYSSREVYSDKIQAYLFYGSDIDFDDLPLRKSKETIWGLFHEESPRNKAELLHESVLNLFNFSSTFSRASDIPFPLFSLNNLGDIVSRKYFVETSQKNTYLKEIAPIMYLQTDCDTATERDVYVKELMKLIRVDSYGACLNNKKLPEMFYKDYLNNLFDEDFLNFIARYKFVIAIENGICEDYVTEKFWRAIVVGTVPIYFGSPLIRDWMPNNNSALLLEDFPTPQIMFEHIQTLLKNDSHYEEYLKHKTHQTISNDKLIKEFNKKPYQSDLLKVVDDFECFICKNIYEKRGRNEINIVNSSHYNCPKPISALSLKVSSSNPWVLYWEISEDNGKNIYNKLVEKWNV